MNTIALTGRISNEPEYKLSQSGYSVCRFTVATNRQTKEGGADFIPCVAFGKTGEFVKKYFDKGQKIDLIGRLSSGSYNNKEGQKVFTLNVTVEKVEFGESKSSKAQHTPADSSETANAPTDKAPTDNNAPQNDFMDIPEGTDELVPF